MLLHVPHTFVIPFGPSKHWELALGSIQPSGFESWLYHFPS